MQQPISYRDIQITGGFWQELQARNTQATMPAVLARFRETGRFDAFRCAREWEEGKRPHFFWDSDVAKWMEAAAYILQKEANPQLEAAVEEIITCLEENQWDDGYFNIYFTAVEPQGRWKNRDAHELYCAGHLMEAAVAYYEATGRRRFLDCMLRYAAHIEQVFMIGQSAAFQTPGHQELELALVRLYRCTKDERWLRLSRWFVEQRSRSAEEIAAMPQWQSPDYNQSHLPAREQTTAEGHAVRALYFYCAMADLAAQGDTGLAEACRTLFDNITQRRMYITGGAGSTHCGEKFTFDYDLPNETAYTETCAAIALALFARRMSTLEPDARYADAAERAIYNGFLSGISEDGTAFFYDNPLEIHPAIRKRGERFAITQRAKVFDCSCCPPNAVRFIASLADFLFTQDENTLYVHHYAGAGTQQIEMTTDYPRSGNVHLRLRGMEGKRAALRIPGWCGAYTCSAEGTLEKGYYYVDLESSDVVLELSLAMPAKLVYANAQVYDNIGRAAVMRGPIVYCLEAADNGENLRALSIAAPAEFDGDFDALTCGGWRLEAEQQLYTAAPPPRKAQRLRFIPYFRFANRGESEMTVWVRTEEGCGR